jgi:protein-tyrosine kinase
MSRIHEALKKAQMELATVEAAGISPASAPQIPSEPSQQKKASPSVRDVISKPATAPTTPRDLEFDQLRISCTHHLWHPQPNVNIFGDHSHLNGCAEQFRSLRSRLYQLRNSQNLKTLLITSAVPNEGKTFVVLNLAQAIVRQPDRRVLIIDADLRCSSLREFIGAPPAPGLTDYLRGDADEAAVIQFGEVGQKGSLCLIPAGAKISNPSELLSNGRIQTLLKRVAPVFDWVIIDSPPCVPVSDASVLADVTDGVVMVIRAGLTSSMLISKARQELQQKNIVSVVLNAVKEKPVAYSPISPD